MTNQERATKVCNEILNEVKKIGSLNPLQDASHTITEILEINFNEIVRELSSYKIVDNDDVGRYFPDEEEMF